MFTKVLKTLIIALTLTCITACGGGGDSTDGKFVGSYVDEFGNKFELRDDHTATIQFKGQDKVNETKWYDGENHDSPFATIAYNGDSKYYFMRDGNLYRHKEDMDNGRPAIKLERQD